VLIQPMCLVPIREGYSGLAYERFKERPCLVLSARNLGRKRRMYGLSTLSRATCTGNIQ